MYIEKATVIKPETKIDYFEISLVRQFSSLVFFDFPFLNFKFSFCYTYFIISFEIFLIFSLSRVHYLVANECSY